MAEPKITFGPNANALDVTPYSQGVLRDILNAIGLPGCEISSTSRNAYNQARVMYQNIELKGVEHQHELYGPYGDKVIDVYSAMKAQGKTKDEIIAGMQAKIIELGPVNVSKHASEPSVYNVFDVSPSSIPRNKWIDLEKAVLADKRVARLLKPPADPGFHLEIPQPKKT